MKNCLINIVRVKAFAACVMSTMVLTTMAQGTAADYRRAYSLYDKFKREKVDHWAHDIHWYDSTYVFSYYIDTPDGRRYKTGNALDGTVNTYASESDMLKALGKSKDVPRATPSSPFRQHEHHWMETDDEQEQQVAVSPDGKMEAWIEGYNVVAHEVGRPYSEKRILTQDGTIGLYYSSNIMWSPDSRKIFVCKRNKVERRYVYYVESSPKDQLQPLLHKQEYAKPGDALPQHWPVIIDVVSGKSVEADASQLDNQFALEWIEWRPDASAVTMEYNRRGHQLYQLLAMDAETGSLKTIVEEKSNTFVNYYRIWRKFINGGKQLLWTSERDNWNHLYVVDMEAALGKAQTTRKQKNGRTYSEGAAPIRQITHGNWFVREIQYVDEEKGVIYFSASGMNKGEDPYLVHYYRIGIDGKNLVGLTPDEGEHAVQYSYDHRYLIDTYSKVDKAPVTQLRLASDGTLVKTLEEADISRIVAEGWVKPEVFTAKGRDGKTDMWGIIQRPTNFDPAKKYPVIEYIYAGPGSAYTPKSFIPYNWNTTALAELGFIVVQLDAMGTSFRGKDFEEVCYKNLQDAGFPDRELWIKAAAEKYPYMDADNVGIYGASAGGQESTAAVLLHGDFYKAAYSSCGCHDNRMDKIWWNEQWMGWPVDSSYVKASNVYNAYRLERPLMLVVGELDDNVDPASTIQVADALIRAGKDFELVVLPGVHHTMGETFGEHKRYDFFVKNLLHVTPPEWKDTGKQ